MTARLCYVEGNWAYFTTRPLDKQWGDDWNDAPYEHNAGDPYEFRDHDAERGERRWEIVRVAWRGPLDTPADLANHNSAFSVEQINRGVVPWLTLDKYATERPPPSECILHAGATVTEFHKFVARHGGEVYCKHDPSPMGQPSA